MNFFKNTWVFFKYFLYNIILNVHIFQCPCAASRSDYLNSGRETEMETQTESKEEKGKEMGREWEGEVEVEMELEKLGSKGIWDPVGGPKNNETANANRIVTDFF